MSEKKKNFPLLRVRRTDYLIFIYVYVFSAMGIERMTRKSYHASMSC